MENKNTLNLRHSTRIIGLGHVAAKIIGLMDDVYADKIVFLFEAGVGIFGQQVIPTMIMLFVAWPVLLTQIWGLVQQSKLDDKALAIAEAVIRKSGSATPQAEIGDRFCTKCGHKVLADAVYCSFCGTKQLY